MAARKFGAAAIVDPRPYLTGTLVDTFEKYPGIGALLPAMGYGEQQISDLGETISRTDCDSVIIGTPIDLSRIVQIDKPSTRVYYSLDEQGSPNLKGDTGRFRPEQGEMSDNAYDVIVVGSGPAGISAALYAARARMKTLVISASEGSLVKADMIENYYGFAEPVAGDKLLEDGRRQAQRLGAELVAGQMVGIGYDTEFIVSANVGEYRSKTVVLAHGFQTANRAQDQKLCRVRGAGPELLRRVRRVLL